jgi:hypothetical protein
VKVIRPEQEAARDEGPRLIPLRNAEEPQDQHSQKLQHYMNLADIALSGGAAINRRNGG